MIPLPRQRNVDWPPEPTANDRMACSERHPIKRLSDVDPHVLDEVLKSGVVAHDAVVAGVVQPHAPVEPICVPALGRLTLDLIGRESQYPKLAAGGGR